MFVQTLVINMDISIIMCKCYACLCLSISLGNASIEFIL